jgi:hypothetical protein
MHEKLDGDDIAGRSSLWSFTRQIVREGAPVLYCHDFSKSTRDSPSVVSDYTDAVCKGYIALREQTPFELMDRLSDSWPCLELRRAAGTLKA